MKKSLFLLFFLFSVQWAAGQQIRLQYSEKPLREVLNEITRQTGYNFVYSEKTVNPLILLDVDYNGPVEPIGRVLDKVFAGTPFAYKINGKQVALTMKQVRQVPVATAVSAKRTGVIKDENGEPLVGVTVRNERTKAYAVSAADGTYAIDAREGDAISFHLMGMDNASIVAGHGVIMDIFMKSNAVALEGVVVTGYQRIAREKVTGAVTAVNSKDLGARITTNLLDNLEGRVAGLMTYKGGMQIRGVSSIHSERTPLLVVDGMPVEMKIADLNPYDIDHVTVLKDAAAAAIYGARASNGILVVTTKKAKSKGKTDVDVTVNYTLYDKTNIDCHENFHMTAAEQVDATLGMLDGMETHATYGKFLNMYASMLQQFSYFGPSPLYMAYHRKLTGKMSDDEFNTYIARIKNNHYAKEIRDHVLRRHQLQQYNIALRNRADRFSSNLVVNFQHDNLGVKGNLSNRFNISYRGGYDVGKWLTANFGVNTIIAKSETCGDEFVTNPWGKAPFMSLYNEDGSYVSHSLSGLSNSYYTVPAGFKSNAYYPLEEMSLNRKETSRINTLLQGELVFKILEGLNINTVFLYETGRTHNNHYIDAESIVVRTAVNAYTQVGVDGSLTYLYPESGGYLSSSDSRNDSWTWRGQLNFNRSFGKHTFDFLAGIEFRQTFSRGIKGLLLGYDDQLQSHNMLAVDFPVLKNLRSNVQYGKFPSSPFIYDRYISNFLGPIREEKHRYASGYANLTYTFNEKYHLFGSFRSDYADIYGLDTRFRGQPLWSVGLSWNMEKEGFLKKCERVDMLKLRASYGITGNIYQGATSHMTASTGKINEFTLQPISEVMTPANPELRWEKTATSNFGIDFAFFNYRLSGSLDLYHKKGTDIFANKLLEDSKGFPSMAMNAASLRNNGIEVMLQGEIFRPSGVGGFQWTSSLTLSYNKNEILEVDTPATKGYELFSSPYKKGYPTSAVWALRFAGMTPENAPYGSMQLFYKDASGTESNYTVFSGNPDDVCVFMGQGDPKTAVSWENRICYKGFSLSGMLVFYGGHVMRMRQMAPQAFTVPFTDTTPMPVEFLNAWTPENTETTVPGVGKYGAMFTSSEYLYADCYVHRGDFIKIRHLALGYSLPQKWLSHLHVGGASLRLQVDNPKPLWMANKLGVDPETEGIRIPTSYILGLNFNF